MDKQSLLAPNQARWPISAKDIEGRVGGILDSADFHASTDAFIDGTAAVIFLKISKPISSMMEQNVWTVDAEDTVEKIEEILSTQGFSSVPVMGSNGVIVGIIGSQELAHFLFGKKNAKVVRAWEISRCTMFEVSPGDSVEEVFKLMAENKIEYIAVTELGALKGVVSMLDLVQAILKENTEEAAQAAQSEPGGRLRRHDD